MTGSRARAYGRVMGTLRDLGAAKLLPAEQARIRHAADTLLFCEDLSSDLAAQMACSEIDALGDHLAASERWRLDLADQLVNDVLACGPVVTMVLDAAA
jgi:hypothetical protein